MHFRAQKKTASDVSLSECIETGKDGTSLSLLDVIDTDEDLFEDLSTRELHAQLRRTIDEVLSPREKGIITLRYGLANQPPQTQREIAERCGISRSYVSRGAYCKRSVSSKTNYLIKSQKTSGCSPNTLF